MFAVQDLLDNVRKVDLQFEIEESMNDTRAIYARLQREQLYAGKLETGEPITPPYAEQTKQYKKRKGQPFNRVTLKDTGEFYKNIFVDVREKEFIIDSADPNREKVDHLIEKYGEDIFGLDEKRSNNYVVNELQPVFQERINKALDL